MGIIILVLGTLFIPRDFPIVDHVDVFEINYILANNMNPFGSAKYLFWDHSNGRKLIDCKYLQNTDYKIIIGKNGAGSIRFFDRSYLCYRLVHFNRHIITRTHYDIEFEEGSREISEGRRRKLLSPPPIERTYSYNAPDLTCP